MSIDFTRIHTNLQSLAELKGSGASYNSKKGTFYKPFFFIFKKNESFNNVLKGIKATKKDISETIDASIKILKNPNENHSQLENDIQKLCHELKAMENGLNSLRRSFSNPKKLQELNKEISDLKKVIQEKLKQLDEQDTLDRKSPEFLHSHFKEKAQKTTKESEALFFKGYTANFERAINLHQALAKEYGSSAIQNEKIVVSIPHFKAAQRMLYDNFPGSTLCACNQEERIYVSQLLQVILTGQIVGGEDLFAFKEIDPKKINLPLSSGKTFIMEHLEQFTPKDHKMNDQEHLKENLHKALAQFKKDCVERKGYIVQINGIQIPLGNENTPPFFEKVCQIQLNNLLDHPQKVSDTLEAYRELLGILDHPFNQEALAKLIEDWGPEYQKLLEFSTIPPDKLQELADKSNCKPEDIAPLLRLKCLELMIIINQTLGSTVDKPLNNYSTFQNPEDENKTAEEFPSTHSSDDSRTFEFSPDLQSFTMHMNYTINEHEHNFQTPQFAQHNKVPVANLETKLTAITHSAQPLVLNALPKVNWNISESFLDHVLGVVNPDVLEEKVDHLLNQEPSEALINQFILWGNANKGNLPAVFKKGEKIHLLIEQSPQSTFKEHALKKLNDNLRWMGEGAKTAEEIAAFEKYFPENFFDKWDFLLPPFKSREPENHSLDPIIYKCILRKIEEAKDAKSILNRLWLVQGLQGEQRDELFQKIREKPRDALLPAQRKILEELDSK